MSWAQVVGGSLRGPRSVAPERLRKRQRRPLYDDWGLMYGAGSSFDWLVLGLPCHCVDRLPMER